MKKFLLSMLALLGTVTTASAYDFISGGLAYNINDDGTSVRVTYIQRPNYIGWDEETGLNIYQPSNPNLSDAVTIPASVFNNGVNYTVTDIEQEAFWGCTSITSISIPATVTSIERNPWNYCDALTQLTVDDANPVYATPENSNTIVAKQDHTVNVWIYNIYNGVPNLYTLPENYLKDQVVAGCNGSIIPSNATTIANYAFQQCRSLTSMIIPEGITSIGRNAFSNCATLQSLSLPSTLTKIEYSAFACCMNLRNVYAYFNPEDVTLGNYVWQEALLPVEFNPAVNLHVYPQYVDWYNNQPSTSPWVWDGNRFNVVGDLGQELYLIGSFNGWNQNEMLPFSKNDEGKWTVTQTMGAGAEFKLKDQDGNWIGGDSNGNFIVTKEQVENGTPLTIIVGGGNNFQIPVAGEWTFTVDTEAKTLVISGEWIEQTIDQAMYIIGSFNNWNQETQEAMTAGENNTWTITKTLDADVTLKFRDELGAWYGAQAEGNFMVSQEQVENGTAITLNTGNGYNDIQIPVAGTWTFTITRGETMTLVISGTWPGGEEPKLGDVNLDGEVDIEDMNIIINIMLETDNADNYDGRANVNGDEKIDIEDMNAVINIMLTQE